MDKKLKSLLWNILKFGVTIAALVYLFLKIDLAAFVDNILETNIFVVLVGGIFVLFVMWLKVARWRLLIGKGELWFLLKSYFVAMFFGAFTPSKIGDFVRGFHVRKKYGLSLTRSMSTVLYDRLLDVLCVFIYGVASFLFLFSTVGGDWSLFLLVMVGVVGIVISYFKLGYILRILLSIFGKLGGKKFKLSPEEISSEIEKISYKRKDIFAFSFVIWFLNYFLWWVFAWLLGFQVGLVHMFVALNIATVIGLLPITVGGFGARELSTVYLLTLYGYNQDMAFLFTILSTTLGILIPAVVGAFFNVKSKDLKY